MATSTRRRGSRRRSGRALRVVHAVAAALALAACPADPTGFHEEEDVERVELVSGGTTLATWDRDGDVWTGALAVGVGAQTALIEVVFLDHDGEEIVFESDHYLEVVVTDESVAEFEQETPGAFAGRLRGVLAGTTSVRFLLYHGAFPTGHLEEETSALTVTVS